MLFHGAGMVQAQTPWTDSMRQVISLQKEDTIQLKNLISLSSAYAFYRPDSALYYGRRALSLAEKLDINESRFWSRIAISGALFLTGNYVLQLDNALQAGTLVEKLDNPYVKGFSNGILGDAYYNMGEYKTSLEYYRKALQVAVSNKLPEVHLLYCGFTPDFIGLGQYDSALFYARLGYDLFRQMPLFNQHNQDADWSRSSHYVFLGDAFAANAVMDSALYYYRLSVPYSDSVFNGINVISAYNGIAGALLSLDQLDSAAWYTRMAMNQQVSAAYPSGRIKSANLLADIYEKKNNPDSSLKNLRLAIAIRDTVYNREKTMAFQNILFKEKEKQQAIEITTVDLANKYRLYLLGLIFTTVLVVTLIILRNRRIRQWQNIRNSIADDLHDEIGSGLSSISIMSELARSKSTESTPLLSSISESASLIQESMSDIVWSVNPKNDRVDLLIGRMEVFASRILEAKNIMLNFSVCGSFDATRLSMQERKNIYLLFKEAVNNAAKHSGASLVNVRISREPKHLELMIDDDGTGFDTRSAIAGNGISSMAKRAADLHGKFSIDSNGTGTAISIRFRIT